ncbi:MAG: helix-turn-helix domain-containing protein [Candidatus Woesebacteria bacterium]|nr:helix-turn-helix domain-containing protein [Candidatus Woesebacteria bacterium]
MNTIGQIIKFARVKKKLSFKKLEEITKIKAVFIKSIEEEKWNILPTFPTVLGFVKSLSTTLEIDPKMAVAVLKRDYPPQKTSINPKPDVFSRFSWNPKFTFAIGTITVVLIVLGYLGYQYTKFISPPGLTVESPKENQIVSGESIPVFGSTDTDVRITVNNQPILVDADGKFSVNLEVGINTKEITIIAISRSGKINEVKRKILVTNN